MQEIKRSLVETNNAEKDPLVNQFKKFFRSYISKEIEENYGYSLDLIIDQEKESDKLQAEKQVTYKLLKNILKSKIEAQQSLFQSQNDFPQKILPIISNFYIFLKLAIDIKENSKEILEGKSSFASTLLKLEIYFP